MRALQDRQDHELGHGSGDAEACKSEEHMPESGVWNRGTRELDSHDLYLYLICRKNLKHKPNA